MTNNSKLKTQNSKLKWYIGGLHFECSQCGNCCSGPDEGYIWITKPEIELLAKHLNLTVEQLRRKYLTRFGLRTSIIEHRQTKDCIFLTDINDSRGCGIYNVRPNQCRIWPFWSTNLKSPYDWNTAAERCPGINRGRLYTFEEIEKIKKQKCWWNDKDSNTNSK